MKSLSVFQTILLAVFGALAISGILIFALVVGGGGSGAVGPVTIWGTLEPNAFAVVIRQAAENNSDFSQVTYVQRDPLQYESLLTEALASGSGPDLFLLRQDYVVKNGGKVVPMPFEFISQSQFESTFVEAADPYLTSEGILGIPIAVDPMVLYWNKDLLAEAGVAKPPEYWDEVPSMAAKIVKKDDAGRITRAAIAFGEYQNVEHAKDIISLLTLQAGGSITQRDATGRLIPTLAARTAGAASQATESAVRFYTEFADPSKIDYSWNRSLRNSRQAFAAGELALYMGFASEQALIARTNPNIDFAMAPVPQIRNSAATNVARVYALSVSRTSKNPNGAMRVASLMGLADFVRSLSAALGVPSARRDVLSEEGEDRDKLAKREALIARAWIDPNPEETSKIFQAMIEGVTSGLARPAEAIGRASQEIAEILEQQQR